jgi:hypothetical protein
MDYKQALKAIMCPESLIEQRETKKKNAARDKSNVPHKSKFDVNQASDELVANIWSYGKPTKRRNKQR